MAKHVCDAPGCNAPRKRNHLMCRSCWARTPRLLREAIVEAWENGRIREWSEVCLTARTWHRDNPRPTGGGQDRVSPERSQQLQRRLLGERDDQDEAA